MHIDVLREAWHRTDWLFDRVPRDRWLQRGIELRHPFLFYIGHLAAFGWNHVRGAIGAPPYDDALDVLFSRGIDPGSVAEAEAGRPTGWPRIADVLAYRDAVRGRLADAWPSVPATVAHLVLEHELMHHETLLYMIAAMEPSCLVPPPDLRPSIPGAATPGGDRVVVGAGPVRLGADLDEIAFGWDNEFPAEIVAVDAFAMDPLPVTVARFLPFVTAGGYADAALWDAGDRSWIAAAGRDHPLRWRRTATGDFEVRDLFGWWPLEAVSGWPVQVSYAEARAFCRWSGARLPTEAEVHRAAFTTPDGGTRRWPWGAADPTPAHGALGFGVHGPTPAGHHPAGTSAWGVGELVGNGWEWTSTLFEPRAGFRAIHASYPGYSADFFDGAHCVVFGGSWATDPRLVRRSFRNWYQGRYPYVFSKFRTVAGSTPVAP